MSPVSHHSMALSHWTASIAAKRPTAAKGPGSWCWTPRVGAPVGGFPYRWFQPLMRPGTGLGSCHTLRSNSILPLEAFFTAHQRSWAAAIGQPSSKHCYFCSPLARAPVTRPKTVGSTQQLQQRALRSLPRVARIVGSGVCRCWNLSHTAHSVGFGTRRSVQWAAWNWMGWMANSSIDGGLAEAIL
jgi:hypothetical protein